MAKNHYFWSKTPSYGPKPSFAFGINWEPPTAICMIKWAPKRACLGFPDFGFFSAVILTNFWLKMIFFLSNTPKMTHSEICFHIR